MPAFWGTASKRVVAKVMQLAHVLFGYGSTGNPRPSSTIGLLFGMHCPWALNSLANEGAYHATLKDVTDSNFRSPTGGKPALVALSLIGWCTSLRMIPGVYCRVSMQKAGLGALSMLVCNLKVRYHCGM